MLPYTYNQHNNRNNSTPYRTTPLTLPHPHQHPSLPLPQRHLDHDSSYFQVPSTQSLHLQPPLLETLTQPPPTLPRLVGDPQQTSSDYTHYSSQLPPPQLHPRLPSFNEIQQSCNTSQPTFMQSAPLPPPKLPSSMQQNHPSSLDGSNNLPSISRILPSLKNATPPPPNLPASSSFAQPTSMSNIKQQQQQTYVSTPLFNKPNFSDNSNSYTSNTLLNKPPYHITAPRSVTDLSTAPSTRSSSSTLTTTATATTTSSSFSSATATPHSPATSFSEEENSNELQDSEAGYKRDTDQEYKVTKYRRTKKACDLCNQKRTKCSGEHPRCSQCVKTNSVCTYLREDKKRGRASSNYPKVIVRRKPTKKQKYLLLQETNHHKSQNDE